VSRTPRPARSPLARAVLAYHAALVGRARTGDHDAPLDAGGAIARGEDLDRLYFAMMEEARRDGRDSTVLLARLDSLRPGEASWPCGCVVEAGGALRACATTECRLPWRRAPTPPDPEGARWLALAYDPVSNNNRACLCSDRADAEREAAGMRGSGWLAGVCLVTPEEVP